MARRKSRRAASARHRARKIAIVPQGRRLFPSLTVTEHLTMLKSARAKAGWTVDRVFGIFPRLAERRHHCGGQLSGGERGMLAVGRALMIDPQLILMDEPSEGLRARHGAAS
ncbi:MAG: ATP-binding cassette domain-containing protein [Bradyrhizobium sp.]